VYAMRLSPWAGCGGKFIGCDHYTVSWVGMSR
jgi:hypothetical protein